jgi:hypothetical protein
MDFKEKNLRKEYAKIISQHPREKNLEIIDKVYRFLKLANDGKKKKEFFTIREIILAFPDEDARIIKRSVTKLSDADYLTLFRDGKRFIYFAAENKEGSFIERIPLQNQKKIDEVKQENFDKIIEFCEKHSTLLNKDLILELERVRVSKDLPHPNWEAYNKLVQNAWNHGFDEFLKLSIRGAANRYSAK